MLLITKFLIMFMKQRQTDWTGRKNQNHRIICESGSTHRPGIEELESRGFISWIFIIPFYGIFILESRSAVADGVKFPSIIKPERTYREGLKG
jgi:hypothetical protein